MSDHKHRYYPRRIEEIGCQGVVCGDAAAAEALAACFELEGLK